MRKLSVLIISIIMVMPMIACGSGKADQSGSQSQSIVNLLDAGYYVASSMMEDGDMTMYNIITAGNGYVKIQDDHTGTIYHNGEEHPLTWDETYFHFDEMSVPYVYITEESSGTDQPMLAVYFLEESKSIVYRPVEESALDIQ